MPRPHSAQRLDGRQRGQLVRCSGPFQRVQEAEAILADLARISFPLGLALWQAGVLDAATIALIPLCRRERAQPIRSRDREGIEGRTQRLGYKLEPVERAHAPRLEQ